MRRGGEFRAVATATGALQKVVTAAALNTNAFSNGSCLSVLSMYPGGLGPVSPDDESRNQAAARHSYR
jgi:hypothetical protein